MRRLSPLWLKLAFLFIVGAGPFWLAVIALAGESRWNLWTGGPWLLAFAAGYSVITSVIAGVTLAAYEVTRGGRWRKLGIAFATFVGLFALLYAATHERPSAQEVANANAASSRERELRSDPRVREKAGTIAKVSDFGTATTSDATRYWYRVEGEGLVQFYVLVRVDSSSGKNAVECIAHRPDMALCVGANYPGPPVSAN